LSALVFNPEHVNGLLPMRACIGVMEQALADLHRGLLTQPRAHVTSVRRELVAVESGFSRTN
jgi:hypothetical protein